MKSSVPFALIPLTLATALAACGEPAPTAEEMAAAERAQDDAAIAEVEEQAEQRAEMVSSNEDLSQAQEFLDKMAQDGAIQIGMAKIAMEDAERDDVKAFAEEAIDFHQQVLVGLRDLADTSEILKINTVLSEEQERNFAQLRGALSVDNMFLERARASYGDIDDALTDYSENGEFEALSSWASEAKPRFDAHREKLAEL